jgi:hypothetical protein
MPSFSIDQAMLAVLDVGLNAGLASSKLQAA